MPSPGLSMHYERILGKYDGCGCGRASLEKAARQVEAMAVKALLYEVTASPKPGLVDSVNTGAHKDMDIFTFIGSATALGPAFHACFHAGAAHCGTPSEVLPWIRVLGIGAESDMFEATGGVNTHKGALFSMGILCAAMGILYSNTSELKHPASVICAMASAIVEGIIERDFSQLKVRDPITYGERLYKAHGITGIRGEVAGGFQTVQEIAMPILRQQWADSDKNQVMTEVLLHLMAHSQDSNILGRHGVEMLVAVKKRAQAVIDAGGAIGPEGVDRMRQLDQWCIDNWVSPGGSADLLAVSLFLMFSES